MVDEQNVDKKKQNITPQGHLSSSPELILFVGALIVWQLGSFWSFGCEKPSAIKSREPVKSDVVQV